MKKTLLFTFAIITMAGHVSGQTDTNVFNHLAAGLSVGTPGIGIDVAMPACKFVQLRAGFDMMPKIKVNTHLDVNIKQYYSSYTTGSLATLPIDRVDVQGKLNLINGKFLVDVLPIPTCSFRVTLGAYFGAGDVVSVYNKEDGALACINDANNKIQQLNEQYAGNPIYEQQKLIGLELGDYLLTPDNAGNVKATINTNTFRPYVGIGYGKAVPSKRIGCLVDLGCMFWGTPTVKDHNDHELTAEDLGSNGGDIVKTISKIKVYPCLSIRLCGRIF